MTARRRAANAQRALACVSGSIELVRPLGLAGVRCAVLAEPGQAACYSRYTTSVLPWADPWTDPAGFVDTLLEFGASQPVPPVLYFEGDWDLLAISRERDRLRELFRFVISDRRLVEDLVDKARFRALADRLGLPVPRSRRLSHAVSMPRDLDLRFPVILKPLTRQNETWTSVGGSAKAVEVKSTQELSELWPRLRAGSVDVLAQELVPGPETAIESYHVYVDSSGDIAADFTGRKIRTHPPAYGHSTALVITDQRDVIALGRDLVRRMALRGVAKFDFKRAPDGDLRLLEVNPRFTLWHHPAAMAGVNIPALVYRDLVGLPRGSVRRARPGVRWCCHLHDARAARQQRIPLRAWAGWALRSECKSAFAWNDPMPLVRISASRTIGTLHRVKEKRLRRDVNALRRFG